MELLKSFICFFPSIRFDCRGWQGIKANTPELPRINDFATILIITWIAGTFHTAEWNLYETEGPQTINH